MIASQLNLSPRTLLELEVSFRLARAEDLENLEWFGLFREHREIFQRAFQAQQEGRNLMLLALHNNLPIGQCWVDLEKRAADETGLIWALRVIPWLQGHGLGSRLLNLAETELARRKYRFAELGVEKHNSRAELLYRKLGYEKAGESLDHYTYHGSDGVRQTVPLDQWIYRKKLPALEQHRTRVQLPEEAPREGI